MLLIRKIHPQHPSPAQTVFSPAVCVKRDVFFESKIIWFLRDWWGTFARCQSPFVGVFIGLDTMDIGVAVINGALPGM